ncbi:methyl-accepting chemotaxis protein [Brevibacillus migulae]|uniref:methyl-accepting chemotaxis protein n=1 Tax=Brevibacillus migulae TaxID=1644114 RepID=UPI00106DD377|nr:methyl-accepting chemotaxis protein [Brevibacillus migulae]
MKIKTIRVKLILFVTILLVASFSLTSFVFFQQMGQVIKDDIETSTANELDSTSTYIATYLDSFARGVEMWSIHSDAYLIEKEKEKWSYLSQSFRNYRKVNPATEVMYIGTASGAMYLEPKTELPADYDPRKRDWYKKAVDNPGKIIWSDPYTSADQNKFVITVATTVMDPTSNSLVGVIAADITLGKISDELSKRKIDYGGNILLLDPNGVAMVHPTMQQKNVKEELPYMKQIYDSPDKQGSIDFVEDGLDKVLIYKKIDGFNWVIGYTFTKDTLFQKINDMRNMIGIVFVLTIGVALLLTYFGANRISKPIVTLATLMERVSKGDLTVQAEANGHDEIARLSLYFNQMMGEMRSLIERIVLAASDVSSYSAQLTRSAQQTTNVSEEVARTIEQVAEGTVSQAVQAEKGNEMMNELADTIVNLVAASDQMAEMGHTAAKANQQGLTQVSHLQQRANENKEVMETIESVIHSLNERAKEIDVIINVITDISNQTSLLSLNAAIEAARAGEHGKGFAVVASEVQKLAQQTSLAADDIRKRIETIQAEAGRAANEMSTKGRTVTQQQYESVADAEKAFREIAASIDHIVSQMHTISTETIEMTRSKDAAVLAIQEISAVSEQAAAAAEEVTASTQEQIAALKGVQEAAEQLTVLSDKLYTATTQFRLHE